MQLQQSLSGGRFVKKFVMQGLTDRTMVNVEGLLGARARLAPGQLGAGGSRQLGGRQPGGRRRPVQAGPGGRENLVKMLVFAGFQRFSWAGAKTS